MKIEEAKNQGMKANLGIKNLLITQFEETIATIEAENGSFPSDEDEDDVKANPDETKMENDDGKLSATKPKNID